MIRRIAVAVAVLLSAVFVIADEHPAVLSGEGVVYIVDPSTSSELRLIRRAGEVSTTVVVPGTEDEAIETDVKLSWDESSNSLFVVWHRTGHRLDQIVLAQLRSDGTWSEHLPLASGAGAVRPGLEVVMTRATDQGISATLLHAAWWQIDNETVPEYALVAFENGKFSSIITTDLKSLAGTTHLDALGNEAMSEVTHPPLAMASSGENGSVDVVFGERDSTRLVRLTVDPKIRADARLWRPSRGITKVTPRAGIQSASGSPVRALLAHERIVLYTPDVKFRYTIFDNVKWSPERMIQLDENLTSEQLVQELRKTIELVLDGDEENDGGGEDVRQ